MIELLLFTTILNIDSFCAALAMGFRRFSFKRASSYGVTAALSGTLATAAGFLAGQASRNIIGIYEHWIIFLFLSLLGVRMCLNGLSHPDSETTQTAQPRKHRYLTILLVSIATSIDNLGVGITLGLTGKPILDYSMAIGFGALLAVLLGLALAKRMRSSTGKSLELIGGSILVILGIKSFTQ
ncbi:MAG: hypothetical protein ER33_02100 [Cyanobium sp. CACIAM 14]|nr:MAG: hypothetical protein ER33_02100 [Cyanobium sp. CACIAM 14]